MIRLLLCGVSFLLFFIIMLPVMLVDMFIKIKSKKTAHKIMQSCLSVEFRIIMWITGSKVTVNGKENMPVMKDDGESIQPCLFVANHRSMVDVVMAYGYTDTRQLVSFISKKEAKAIPFLGWCMVLMNGIFLDRKDLKQGLACIEQAQSLIKDEGISVWIFPEGTRNKGADEKELLDFRPGSFRVATKTGSPIVPVFISGTREVFETHLPFVRPSNVSITYGKPIWPDQLDDEQRKHIGEYFKKVITEMGQQQ